MIRNGSPKAYRELTSALLSVEERQTFEWAIGAVLSGAPPEVVTILGYTGSGKSTLVKIVKKILGFAFVQGIVGVTPNVDFLDWDSAIPHVGENAFVFVETNAGDTIEPNSIVIQTTGDRIPANKYYVLMTQIDTELPEIAEACIERYRSMGDGYYNTQENHK
jgi:ABC-type uncharacterized transport system ATPase subunit